MTALQFGLIDSDFCCDCTGGMPVTRILARRPSMRLIREAAESHPHSRIVRLAPGRGVHGVVLGVLEDETLSVASLPILTVVPLPARLDDLGQRRRPKRPRLTEAPAISPHTDRECGPPDLNVAMDAMAALITEAAPDLDPVIIDRAAVRLVVGAEQLGDSLETAVRGRYVAVYFQGSGPDRAVAVWDGSTPIDPPGVGWYAVVVPLADGEWVSHEYSSETSAELLGKVGS